MKRLMTAFGLAGLAAFAMAMASFTKDFENTYKFSKDSELGKAKCGACHGSKMGGKTLNAYGKDLQAAMQEAKTKKLTSDIYKKVDGLDSDKDGVKNGDELKAGHLPGTPKA